MERDVRKRTEEQGGIGEGRFRQELIREKG